VGAAEKTVANLHSMPDHPALAMLADGSDGLDRTFEAIERMPRAGGDQLKTLVVLIATNFARCHTNLLHAAFTDELDVDALDVSWLGDVVPNSNLRTQALARFI